MPRLSPESIKYSRILAPSLVLAIGLTGCGESSNSDTNTPPPKKTTVSKSGGNGDDIKITYLFTPTGKRITQFEGATPGGIYFIDKIAYCEGGDLVEQVAQYHSDAGSGTSRSVNHPACNDGKLTPTDFPAPQQ